MQNNYVPDFYTSLSQIFAKEPRPIETKLELAF